LHKIIYGRFTRLQLKQLLYIYCLILKSISAGQGTGLGLSLSYDIIKAHGGEIKVDSKESEGSEFIVQFPLKDNI